MVGGGSQLHGRNRYQVEGKYICSWGTGRGERHICGDLEGRHCRARSPSGSQGHGEGVASVVFGVSVYCSRGARSGREHRLRAAASGDIKPWMEHGPHEYDAAVRQRFVKLGRLWRR